MSDPFIGKAVGSYVLVHPLGTGAFGSVYEAQHRSLPGRRAAVKLLHRHMALDQDMRRRFLVEADVACRVDHENIVQVFDVGEAEEGLCYVVMELLRGVSLSQLLRTGPLGVARTLNIAAQIASALAAAHQKGVVHRDLKPANVLLVARDTNPEFVKVLDFGIAKLQNGDGQTQTGQWMGTPAYMSPEQWQTRPDLDGRADIYALGVILFGCLTGQLPYRAENQFDWLTAHLTAPIPDPATLVAVPPALSQLVQGMLAKDRAQRPQSMAQVHQILRGMQGASGAHAAVMTPPGLPKVTPTPLPAPVPPAVAAAGQTTITSGNAEMRAAGRGRGRWLRRGLFFSGAAAAGGLLLLGLWGREPQPVATSVPAPVPPRPAEKTEPRPQEKKEPPAAAPYPAELVVLGPGRFLMGAGPARRDRAEGPAHAVEVARFALGKFEVSMEEFRRYAEQAGLAGPLPWDGVASFAAVAPLPVNQVTRAQAEGYCRWRYAAYAGRLPSEAEWEFAARGGLSERRYPWAEPRLAPGRANVGRTEVTALLQPATAGAGGASEQGLLNLIGNVAEWVADEAVPYPGSPVRILATHRGVVRGGGATNRDKQLSAATRAFVPPETRDAFIGFRCAATAP